MRWVLFHQITGVTTWAESAFNTLLQQCLTRVEFDVDLWQTVTINGTQTLQPPLNILDAILCNNNCSNHGQCINGELEAECLLQ